MRLAYWRMQLHPDDSKRSSAHAAHYPFALVEIAGDYAYVPNAKEAFGVWFRHLRLIRNPRFYADYATNPKTWERIPMTDTLAPLRSIDGATYKLIEGWATSQG